MGVGYGCIRVVAGWQRTWSMVTRPQVGLPHVDVATSEPSAGVVPNLTPAGMGYGTPAFSAGVSNAP